MLPSNFWRVILNSFPCTSTVGQAAAGEQEAGKSSGLPPVPCCLSSAPPPTQCLHTPHLGPWCLSPTPSPFVPLPPALLLDPILQMPLMQCLHSQGPAPPTTCLPFSNPALPSPWCFGSCWGFAEAQSREHETCAVSSPYPAQPRSSYNGNRFSHSAAGRSTFFKFPDCNPSKAPAGAGVAGVVVGCKGQCKAKARGHWEWGPKAAIAPTLDSGLRVRVVTPLDSTLRQEACPPMSNGGPPCTPHLQVNTVFFK